MTARLMRAALVAVLAAMALTAVSAGVPHRTAHTVRPASPAEIVRHDLQDARACLDAGPPACRVGRDGSVRWATP